MSFQLRVNLSHKRPHLQPSKEPPPALHQPLSLEQSSMNCIVTNLEKYSPDVLALLPLHFRRELLLLLPPADIFQLEQTKVVEGIDMDNEIWKVVSGCYNYEVARRAHIQYGNAGLNFGTVRVQLQRGRQLPLPSGTESLGPNSPQPVSWRDHFISSVVSFLCSMKPLQLGGTEYADVCDYYASHFGYRNYIILLQLLFSRKFLKLKELTDVGGFPLQVSGVTVIPSRYSRFFTSLVPLSEWVQFLLEDCHIRPPNVIKIDLDQFNFESPESLQHFFTNVKDFRLFIKSQPAKNQQAAEEATMEKMTQLCDILSPCQLENVSMTQNVNVLRSGCYVHVLRKVTDQSLFNNVLQKCFFQSQFVAVEDLKPLNIFCDLKCIDIQCLSFGVDIELSTLCSLLVFAQNHGFKSISVSGPIVKYNEQQLETVMKVLERSFTAPISAMCSSISLCNMRPIPFSFLFWLMKSFLFSPSTVAQKMVVSCCEIDYSYLPSEKAFMEHVSQPGTNTGFKKSLHLTNITLERPFVDTLAHFPSLVVDELHLEHTSHMGYHHRYVIATETLGALFLTLPTIPVCRIKSLSIQLIISNVQKSFESNQRRFELESCDSNLISAVIPLAKKLPETTISFQCGILSKHVEQLLACLYDEWNKNDEHVPLNRLLIQLSGSLAKTPEFRSSLEKSLMVYPIHDIARNVDIREHGKASSIFDTEKSNDCHD